MARSQAGEELSRLAERLATPLCKTITAEIQVLMPLIDPSTAPVSKV
jgi:hypothetical protein